MNIKDMISRLVCKTALALLHINVIQRYLLRRFEITVIPDSIEGRWNTYSAGRLICNGPATNMKEAEYLASIECMTCFKWFQKLVMLGC